MANSFLKIYKGTTYAPQASAPSNPVDGDVYYDSTLNKFRGYQNGSWQDLITDGADGINYIDNPGAEAGTDGYVTYADAAATSPVDGTGGSPSFVTWTRTTTASEILRQDASFKLSKSSGNAQGEGVAYDLSIDPQDLDKKLQVSFEYKNLDTNYVNGDLKIFVYDVDNSTLIGEVTNDDDGDVLVSGDNGSAFYGEFITTDSLNYRLIFHIAGTTSANWAMSVDSIKTGPISAYLGYNSSDMEDITTYANSNILPIGMGAGVGTYDYYEIGRRGDLLHVRFGYNHTATPGSGVASVEFPLPNNLAVKFEASRFGGSGLSFNVDHNVAQSSGADQYMAFQPYASSADTIRMTRMGTGSTVRGDQILTNAQIYVDMLIPIETWVSSNLVSNNQLNRKTAHLIGAAPGTQTVLNNTDTPVEFNVTSDPTNSWDGTDTFTAPSSGFYLINGGWGYGGNPGGSSSVFCRIHKNGSSVMTTTTITEAAAATWSADISHGILLEKGDTIQIVAFQNSGVTQTINSTTSYISIIAVPDFTSYGVLNPKTEYREAIYQDSTGDITNSSSFVSPGPSEFDLELTEGEWLVGYSISVAQESLGATGNMNMQAALHLDGVIDANTTTYAFTSIDSTNQGQYHMMSSVGKVTVNGTQDLQLRLQGLRTSASLRNRMISVNWTGGLAGIDSAPKLWALKIK